MKRMILFFAMASLVSGCATVRTLPGTADVKIEGHEVVETVEVSNTCWEFFSCLPIASGDVENPNGCWCIWFSDTETLANQMKMLEAEAARVGASRALSVTTVTTDEVWIPILFLIEKIHTSAVLIK